MMQRRKTGFIPIWNAPVRQVMAAGASKYRRVFYAGRILEPLMLSRPFILALLLLLLLAAAPPVHAQERLMPIVMELGGLR